MIKYEMQGFNWKTQHFNKYRTMIVKISKTYKQY